MNVALIARTPCVPRTRGRAIAGVEIELLATRDAVFAVEIKGKLTFLVFGGLGVGECEKSSDVIAAVVGCLGDVALFSRVDGAVSCVILPDSRRGEVVFLTGFNRSCETSCSGEYSGEDGLGEHVDGSGSEKCVSDTL